MSSSEPSASSPSELAVHIPPGITGLVFDLDGTIADTMPLHYEAWVAALGEHGVEFPEAIFYEFAGMPTPKIIETLNQRHGHTMPVHETADRKEKLFEVMIPKVTFIHPVMDIIRAYTGKLPMAVATGGTRAIAGRTLQSLGIAALFKALVTADDVEHGKPAPDIFLESARRIGVSPECCMAFEDGDLGIQSAAAAGMQVIDVRKLPGYRQPR
jgi:beta-phosphoglucomutase family hydrolase